MMKHLTSREKDIFLKLGRYVATLVDGASSAPKRLEMCLSVLFQFLKVQLPRRRACVFDDVVCGVVKRESVTSLG